MNFIQDPTGTTVVEIDNPTPEEQIYINGLIAQGWVPYVPEPAVQSSPNAPFPGQETSALTPAQGVETVAPGIVDQFRTIAQQTVNLNEQADLARQRFELNQANALTQFRRQRNQVRGNNANSLGFQSSNQLSGQFRRLQEDLGADREANRITQQSALNGIRQQEDALRLGLSSQFPSFDVDEILASAIRAGEATR